MNTFDMISKINNFKSLNVLVLGDVMIDAYITGKVDRISPEAPVPVVSVQNRYNRLGGAANVALNVKSLGANPILCTVIGDDLRGDDFIQMMDELKLPSQGIIRSKSRPTTTKFRIIGNNTQMLRVDEESLEPLSSEEFIKLSVCVIDLLDQNKIDAIIIEDYDKGCINADLIDLVTSEARSRNIICTADPKHINFDNYSNLSLFKPNLKELNEGMNTWVNSSDFEGIAQLSQRILNERNMDMLMVTLSEHGLIICNKDQFHHIPAQIRQIADVSGAGDTVISTVTLSLAAGFSMQESAALANIAGGLVCEHVGVVPVDINDFKAEITSIFQ